MNDIVKDRDKWASLAYEVAAERDALKAHVAELEQYKAKLEASYGELERERAALSSRQLDVDRLNERIKVIEEKRDDYAANWAIAAHDLDAERARSERLRNALTEWVNTYAESFGGESHNHFSEFCSGVMGSAECDCGAASIRALAATE